MSTFRLKPDKQRHHVDTKTLDETHRKAMINFKKKRELLPKKKGKLEKEQRKLESIETKDSSLYTNNDIIERSKLKTDIYQMKEEINDIENNISETEYLFKTDEILMEYYDLVELEDDILYENNPELEKEKCTESTNAQDHNSCDQKISALDRLNIIKKSKQKAKATVRKKKYKAFETRQNSIFNYLEIESKDEEKENNDGNQNKAELHEKYLMLTNSKAYYNQKKSLDQNNFCDECDQEKVLLHSEGIYVCMGCDQFDMIVTEAENPCGGDGGNMGMENKGYPYKRKNHFSESTNFSLLK